MPSNKYAYYNKGNKIALIEKSATSSSGRLAVAHCTASGYTTKDTCEAAGGQWIPGSSGSLDSFNEYTSPVSSVSKGLEIEYTYAPIYWLSMNRHIGWNITSTTDERNSSIYSPVYGEISGYLTFFFPAIVANNGVLDVSSLNDGRSIVCQNHPQWGGVHKIKVASAQGYIQTTTKWNSGLNRLEEDDNAGNPVFNATEIIQQSGATSFNEGFSIGDYVFNTSNMTNSDNEGLWRISALSSDGTSVTVDKNYYSDTATSGELASATAALQGETYTAGDLFIAQVLFSEGAYLDINGVNVLEDESFELDLTRTQAIAVEAFLRSKIAESVGNIEMHEYFMTKFRRLLEKASGSRKYGPYKIQGHGMTRK